MGAFEEGFKEACEEFVKSNPQSKISCDTFWKMFTSAFVRKNPSKITPADYDNMLNAVPVITPQNKLLLYSGTDSDLLEFVLKDKTYVDVGRTIYGILDGIGLWCGKENSDAVLTDDCPENPYNMYWTAVSAGLAKKALGIVTVLLDGTLGYRSESTLAKDEVPNLDEKVTGLRVLMVNKDGVNGKNCGHESLKKLQDDIKLVHNIPYECRYILSTVLGTKSPADWWNVAQSG
ncbi:ADP-ribosyl cyclase/cyclic ADP-ribose hydrolase 1-like [Centroberyx affinis]|uniref:ADP-ribosyl cyclase/cyclic ADP-ribose hydrolase 1-like n=1 Tax=Centroberyx affinis TaxID=166261 RepID=UPI003A5BE0D2